MKRKALNKINGKSYVGNWVNLSLRLKNYFSTNFLAKCPRFFFYALALKKKSARVKKHQNIIVKYTMLFCFMVMIIFV